jgi:adenosylhomocysteine nucleosidase
MPEVAMIAALEREVWPLVRRWRNAKREHDGRNFRFFESDASVIVCGGIGPEAARRATEAVIASYCPAAIVSVGFAGALDSSLRVGDIVEPRFVVDARDGSKTDTGEGSGVLISYASVAGPEQKAKLAKSYGACAVDMEAAAVAKGAAARGLKFAALKAISDEAGFPMPPMDRFVTADGSFQSSKLTAYVAVRPWTWPTTYRLARNSTVAAEKLCERLASGKMFSVSARVS